MMIDPYLTMLGHMKDAGETQRWGVPVNFWRTIPLEHHTNNLQDALCLIEALSYSGPWQISLECLLTLHEACGADLVDVPLYEVASAAVTTNLHRASKAWEVRGPLPVEVQRHNGCRKAPPGKGLDRGSRNANQKPPCLYEDATTGAP